jgi:hypothetical protein
MKELFISAVIIFAIIVSFSLGIKLVGGSDTFKAGILVEKAIKDCEVALPRNQKCVIVGYEFKIEEIKQ